MPCIVSGGVGPDGFVTNKVFGLSFSQSEINGMRVLEAKKVQIFQNLPNPRFLHQSAAVRIKGLSYLFVFGGKQDPMIPTVEKSVYKLKIH